MATIEETKTYDNWYTFICDIEKSSKDGNKIYRGHSNDPNKSKNEWKLLSSYNRIHSHTPNVYHFRTILNQHLSSDIFPKYFGDYSFKNMDYLKNCSSVQRAYYFQHYGIPTCFIDFTKCPLIASYFGISSLPGTNVTYADENNDIIPFADDAFITVFELYHEKLINDLKIKEIKSNNFNSKSYDDFLKYIWNPGVHIGIDLNPLNGYPDSNYNLNQQKGVFILFDNYNCDTDLSLFVQNIADELNIEDNILKIYRLKTNSIYQNILIGNRKHTLYSYLKSQKCSGKFLFDDLQGLKYDFNFLHS